MGLSHPALYLLNDQARIFLIYQVHGGADQRHDVVAIRMPVHGNHPGLRVVARKGAEER